MLPSIDEWAKLLDEKLHVCRTEEVRPEALAELFQVSLCHPTHGHILSNALRSFLIHRTVEHAVQQCRFYSSSVYEQELPPTPPGEAPDITVWPVLTRADVTAYLPDILAKDMHVASICHTSGSTGPPLHVYKSKAEVDFLQRYYSRLLYDSSLDTPLPLTLSLPNLYHGAGLPLPTLGTPVVGGVTDDTLVQDTVATLTTDFEVPGHDARISVVSGLAFHVIFLTNYLLEHGCKPRDLGIRSINLAGEFVPKTVRDLLQETWGALIFDRYSLTEVVGGASRCLGCEHFHIDPHLIAEIVDPYNGQAAENVGHLVLTTPYPFVQMQPLLRYDTGDLVRQTKSQCTQDMTFQFLGKAANCVEWVPPSTGRQATEYLLYSATLYEVVSEIPDVAQYEWFANVKTAKDRAAGERQLYSVRASPSDTVPFNLDIEVELRYSPYMFPQRVGELRQKIENAILADNTQLERRVGEGSVKLLTSFVGPGGLRDNVTIKI